MKRIKKEKLSAISLFNKTLHMNDEPSFHEKDILKDVEMAHTFAGYPIPLVSFNREMNRLKH